MPGPRGGRKTSWQTKDWKEVRSRELKDACEQCGSTNPPLVMNHCAPKGFRAPMTREHYLAATKLTLCKKCAFLWDMKGVRLCQLCKRRFHAHKYRRCAECGAKHMQMAFRASDGRSETELFVEITGSPNDPRAKLILAEYAMAQDEWAARQDYPPDGILRSIAAKHGWAVSESDDKRRAQAHALTRARAAKPETE